MSRLTTHISSHYFKAADALTSRLAPRKIVAYVESYDDVFFWRSILSEVERENDGVVFEILLPTLSPNGRQLLARGKSSAVRAILKQTGENMIACVDADYDYLMQGRGEHSRQLLSSPYIFHTYAYAIENLQCYAPGLHEACVMSTLNDKRVFDFPAFLQSFSEIVYPLFLWSVWFYRREDYSPLTIADMNNIVRLRIKTLQGAEQDLQRLQHRVSIFVKSLQRDYPGKKESLAKLSQELRTLGVTPENTYLYIHGHHLLEHIILPLATLVCKYLRKIREQEISTMSKHDTQRQNELSCYNNSVLDIKSVLKKNTAYLSSPQVRKIIGDIGAVLSR